MELLLFFFLKKKKSKNTLLFQNVGLVTTFCAVSIYSMLKVRGEIFFKKHLTSLAKQEGWLVTAGAISARILPPPPSPWCLVKQWELSYASLCKRLRKEMALYRPNDTKNPPKQTWKEREGQAEKGGGEEIPS